MTKNQIANEAEYVLPLAIAKCGDFHDAQDLTQETLLSALVYLEKGGTVAHPRAFLAALLNCKYCDMLRRKYRLPTVSIGEGFDLVDDADMDEEIVRREEAEAIRREVAYLTASYRTVMVKHYFQGKSLEAIAEELCLPVGTVKSRLAFGRKQMKKDGIEKMETYQENSYMPQSLHLSNSGGNGMNGEPISLVEGDLLAQNLLILAYAKPISVSDLSRAIGVATAYVEPVIRRLVDGELMKRMGNGKVYTDFILYHANDFVQYIHEEERFAETHAEAYIEPVKTAIGEFKQTPFYHERLERFMMIQVAEEGLYRSMEPCREKPQIFPDRPNGGKWIAFATIVADNQKIPPEKCGKEEYVLAGRRCTTIDHYLDAQKLKLYNYETSLDPASRSKHEGYGFNSFWEVESNMLKLFYLLKKRLDPQAVDLDARMVKSIPLLEERGFLTTEKGVPELLIPVLSHKEERMFFAICDRAQRAFGDNIRPALAEWCKTHRKEIPPHLKSVPDQKCTLPYEPNAMMFVYAAIRQGVHPRELGYPCPETIAVFD